MPVFINKVVFRGDIQPGPAVGDKPAAAASGAAEDSAAQAALIEAVTRAVLDHLERERDRGEAR